MLGDVGPDAGGEVGDDSRRRDGDRGLAEEFLEAAERRSGRAGSADEAAGHGTVPCDEVLDQRGLPDARRADEDHTRGTVRAGSPDLFEHCVFGDSADEFAYRLRRGGGGGERRDRGRRVEQVVFQRDRVGMRIETQVVTEGLPESAQYAEGVDRASVVVQRTSEGPRGALAVGVPLTQRRQQRDRATVLADRAQRVGCGLGELGTYLREPDEFGCDVGDVGDFRKRFAPP